MLPNAKSGSLKGNKSMLYMLKSLLMVDCMTFWERKSLIFQCEITKKDVNIVYIVALSSCNPNVDANFVELRQILFHDIKVTKIESALPYSKKIKRYYCWFQTTP